MFKHVVLRDETAFVENSYFWHKNENAYDQMHSPCDFLKPKNLQRFALYYTHRKKYGTLKVITIHFRCVTGIHGGAASHAGDVDSSRAPGLTSGLQWSVNVHRDALL